MKNLFVLLVLVLVGFPCFSQKLKVVEQDYDKALKLAKAENKLLLVDFYTTWCGPCKKMDKLIFKNDSISKELAKDFVLLKYDAEKDSVFHLSKKHHINSYPTSLVLNKNGYVVNRKYGYAGEEFEEMNKDLSEFFEKSVELNAKKHFLKGYSNQIDGFGYPKFYVDYVNRTDTKSKKREDFKAFWEQERDFLSENDFSVLAYFSMDVPDNVAQSFLQNKTKLIDLYGIQDVDIIAFFISMTKFDEAVDAKSRKKYEEAVAYSKQALDEESSNNLLAMYQDELKELEKSENR